MIHKAFEGRRGRRTVGSKCGRCREAAPEEEDGDQGLETLQFLRSSRNHRLYPLFLLAVTTSLSRSELVGLRWEDVDLQNGLPTQWPPHQCPQHVIKALPPGKEAGMPIIRFHALRHTHATALQDMGLPVKAVQERLGHSEGYVTLGYSHVLPSTEERVLRREKGSEWPAVMPPFVRERRTKR